MGSISTYDLGGVFAFFGTLVAIVAVVVVAVVLLARWRRPQGQRGLVVRATLSLSWASAALLIIAIPFAVAQTMTSVEVIIQDFPFVTTEELSGVGSTESPGVPALKYLGLDSGTATVVGLSTGVRILIASDQVAWALVAILPIVSIGLICFQLLRGAPFTRTVVRVLLIAAGAVLVLGMAAALLDGISRGAASMEVLPPGESGEALTAGAYRVEVPFWPLGAALGLAALAAVFRYGDRLQKDTEGLV